MLCELGFSNDKSCGWNLVGCNVRLLQAFRTSPSGVALGAMPVNSAVHRFWGGLKTEGWNIIIEGNFFFFWSECFGPGFDKGKRGNERLVVIKG